MSKINKNDSRTFPCHSGKLHQENQQKDGGTCLKLPEISIDEEKTN